MPQPWNYIQYHVHFSVTLKINRVAMVNLAFKGEGGSEALNILEKLVYINHNRLKKTLLYMFLQQCYHAPLRLSELLY